MNIDIKKEIRKYVSKEAICYLSTTDKNNDYASEVRPISIMEKDWIFYLATSKKSRKAKEMQAHPKVGLLMPFSDGVNKGYLRIAGDIKVIDNIETRKEIGKHSEYNIEHHWGGYDDPNLFFAQVIPKRIEFMNPGEWEAWDVTKEFQEV